MLRARRQSGSQKGRNGLPARGEGPGQTETGAQGQDSDASTSQKSRGSAPGQNLGPWQHRRVAGAPGNAVGSGRGGALKSQDLLTWLEERIWQPSVCRQIVLFPTFQAAGLGGCSQGFSAKSLSEFDSKYIRLCRAAHPKRPPWPTYLIFIGLQLNFRVNSKRPSKMSASSQKC